MEFMAAFKGVGNLAIALAGKLERALPPWRVVTDRRADAATLNRKNIF